MSGHIGTASRQWATRPDDQRFLTLPDLQASVEKRKNESWTATPAVSDLRMIATEDNDLRVEVYDPTQGQKRELIPTNHSFSQLSAYAKAPASYMRQLPAQLAAINIQWGLEHNPQREESLMLAQSNGEHSLRAMTSTSYGRIWDLDIVKRVRKLVDNSGGEWQIPAASYATTNPKRATTLYASDRDIFIFLVNPNSYVEVGGTRLFRGFFTWNSEVGAATFGLTTFLYEYVCDNRNIWGATDVRELRIRHTGGAPERFQYEGAKYLNKYAQESTAGLAEAIKAAQNKDLHSEINTKAGNTVESWLQKRGFTKAQAKGTVDTATAERGQARSLWDIMYGATAYARTIPHTNDRIDLESRAGKLMDLVK